jgi:hypothetical protein
VVFERWKDEGGFYGEVGEYTVLCRVRYGRKPLVHHREEVPFSS